MKLQICRTGHDDLVLEFDIGLTAFVSVSDGEKLIGEIGIDKYGGELRVHLWGEENIYGDPTQTVKLADIDTKHGRSILDIAREKE